VWRDPITFYNNIFAYGAISPRAHNNLAIAYAQANDVPHAIAEYRHAIKEGDTYAETHYNLALSLLNASHDKPELVQEAINELQRSLEIEPRFFRSDIALSQIYARQGQAAKAAEYDIKAREILGE
jgi:tetratricopeptide (TPR) repeat protein